MWLMLWTTMLAGAGTEHAMARAGALTCVSKLAQGAAMLLLGHVLASTPYRVTLADAWSGPSLLMAGGLAAMAVACLILLFAYTPGRQRVNRTAFGGTTAQPHPMGRTVRAPGWRSP